MARRYADGRSSYAPSLVNSCVRAMLRLGVELNPGGEQTVWATDGMGHIYDGLTEEMRTPGTPAAQGQLTVDELDKLIETIGI